MSYWLPIVVCMYYRPRFSNLKCYKKIYFFIHEFML